MQELVIQCCDIRKVVDFDCCETCHEDEGKYVYRADVPHDVREVYGRFGNIASSSRICCFAESNSCDFTDAQWHCVVGHAIERTHEESKECTS